MLSDQGKGLAGATVLVLGVAYKPGVEDVRESPALEIIEGLRSGGARVRYHDPFVPLLTLGDGSALASVEPSPVDLVIRARPGSPSPPILHSGAIGLRGDNCEFEFTDLRAHPIK